ncbi:MAG: transposase [Planctomycetaceae bacterium]|jgi:hypothetical protein|nr:transposase [Planctomycetaceae bacterium]
MKIKRARLDALLFIAIETILALRELFHLTYRAAEGFVCGLVRLMKIEAPIPKFTSLAKQG